ncbi:fasciculation and elongation protein zeta-2-like isoform X1 [Clupea harengus]|uniref:Fasciculation and elongation protein zeta-2-like isoform X1 n=1 Tax=Clupea harengus TaxID=7950 RepID=A0A6P8GSA6_CLUHA|nr:fasciculation and elongation protein zeta-2-like isoform X1 [Clupea harengus]
MAAPLAHFDEDWQDFNEFRPTAEWPNQLDQINSNVGGTTGFEDFSDLDNSFSGEICSFKSMEDLVNDFDEKLNMCFRNYNTKIENIAPVKPITEDNFLKDDEIWNALTDNYGNVMPVDWKTSHTRTLHLPTLNLTEQRKEDNSSLDLSDDEELREQMDMHSIIVSCVAAEPLFTAEQVIEEIEEIMQESPDPVEDDSPSQSDVSILCQEMNTLNRSSSTSSYEESLRGLSASELSGRLQQVETLIRGLSEELVQQLALRDELDFEKEVKNRFISLLITVQNRQKEHRQLLKKRGKIRSPSLQTRGERTHVPGTRFTMEGLSSVIQSGLRHTFRGTGGDKQYLTTVIPYEQNNGPPSVEDLQYLTKILHAMKDDSDKVPSLLTEYILKVLCPS